MRSKECIKHSIVDPILQLLLLAPIFWYVNLLHHHLFPESLQLLTPRFFCINPTNILLTMLLHLIIIFSAVLEHLIRRSLGSDGFSWTPPCRNVVGQIVSFHWQEWLQLLRSQEGLWNNWRERERKGIQWAMIQWMTLGGCFIVHVMPLWWSLAGSQKKMPV